ncbi:MAG: ATP-binding protein [Armatimonas sp.]
MSLSITWRARILSGSLSALTLVALVFLAQSRIRTTLYNGVDEALREQAHGLIRDPRFAAARGQFPPFGEGRPAPFQPGSPIDDGPPGFPDGPRGDDEEGERHQDNRPFRRRGRPGGFGRIGLLKPRRLPLERQEDTPEPPPPWSDAGVQAVRTAQVAKEDIRDEIGEGGELLRVFSIRLPEAILQTASKLDGTEAALQEIKGGLYSLLLPLSLLSFVLGALLTEVVLAPVRRIAQAAAAIAPDNLATRLPAPGGGDTFDRLVGSLNAMLARLEDAFERQKRFTADASHELRTPLSVIKAATSFLLEDEALTPSQRRSIARADTTADRANRLVSDLLLLARTENGALKVSQKEISLTSLLTEVVTDAEATHTGPHAPITLSVPETARLTTDPDLLRRLVSNLLCNALRHTPETGSVIVRWESGTLTVADTGEGIPAEALPRIGEPFFRPDSSRARSGGGAGLGLAICKEIAHALGSNLEIQSEQGKGTTVTIALRES